MLSLVNFNKNVYNSWVTTHLLELPGFLRGVLILSCTWRWLLSLSNISIRALQYNSPCHYNHGKSHSRRGVDLKDLPVYACGLWTTQLSVKVIYTLTSPPVAQEATQSFQWTERRLGMNSGCLGWMKGNLSACHNARLLWRGTCLVRVAWSHTADQLSVLRLYRRISMGVPHYCFLYLSSAVHFL